MFLEISLSITFLAIGFFWGRWSKLRQLHALQDEGLLTVKFHPKESTPLPLTDEEEARRVRELIYQDDEKAKAPVPLRKVNWAQQIKEKELE